MRLLLPDGAPRQRTLKCCVSLQRTEQRWLFSSRESGCSLVTEILICRTIPTSLTVGGTGPPGPTTLFYSKASRLFSATQVRLPDCRGMAWSAFLSGGLPPTAHPGKALLFPVTPRTAAPPPTRAVWTLPGPRSSPSPAGGSGSLPQLWPLTSPANLYPRANSATNRENKQTPARGGGRAWPRPRSAPRLSRRPLRRDFPPALGSQPRSPRPSPQPAAALPSAGRPACPARRPLAGPVSARRPLAGPPHDPCPAQVRPRPLTQPSPNAQCGRPRSRGSGGGGRGRRERRAEPAAGEAR